MPNGSHAVEISLPLDKVLAFVHDRDNWMPLMPGYMKHELQSDREATWLFKGDLGFTKKVIELKLTRTGSTEESRFSFDLEGISDSVEGDGYFEADALDAERTRLTGYLDISGKGAMGFMMNSVMKTFVPQTVQQLTQAVADKLAADEPS